MFELAWWIAAASLFMGCFVQTAIGFGMAVVAAPVVVLVSPQWVPVILTVTALLLSIGNTWNQRQHIQLDQLAPAFVTRVPGTLVGAWILTHLPTQLLQILVAATVFAAVAITAFARPFPASQRNLALAGFFSGITGTTTSIGGPPMVLVMQHGNGNNVRANLSLYFVYSCVLALVSYQWLGLMSKELWVISLSFLPVAWLGFQSGKLARPWVDQRFRPILLILCSLSALVALVGAVK